ncbi:nucleolar protein 14 isoform X2 [Xenopus tropicalis]|uniref:NOP14 nucleolar protein n=1 Tax=Xenopus tropicalis TaxID=8364 RepID=L7N3G9_XENTR|nr:nucleolar protein 14 isoform X2 [Xenopus tropicalis]
MGKSAGKKGKPPAAAAAARVIAQKARTEIRDNPFEVKINKQKFNVLGRKTGKHDVGLPGVSKSKALKRRKDTILMEYQRRGKVSVFMDKRFGEYDTKLTPDEKMMKRFAMERKKNAERKTLYNLNEEEELTHYGQSLANLEKLNDTVDSDSDSEERGALSAELTASHFGGGGGLLRKKAQSDQKDEEAEKPKSRKELIEELIIKSKQEKRERQSQKEKSLELTEKLDSDWKAIQGLLSHKTPKSERKTEEEKPKPDEYDKIVRELGFEMKAQPTDRMKSEEELAKEEQERLQKLEAERLRRMRGDKDQKSKRAKHISADDLMDGFILDNDDRVMLSYKDGAMNLPEDIELEDVGKDTIGDEDEEGSGDEEEEEGSGDDEEGSSGEEEDVEGSEDDASDNYSDLESDAERKSGAKAAKSELPFTFAAPESYESFQSLLSGKPVEQQLVVLERIQKCNHPSLAEGNKAKLEKLFGFLLDYITDLASMDSPDLKAIDKLVIPLYNLCQMFPEAAGTCVRNALDESARAIDKMVEAKGRAALQGIHVLVHLKITAILFPTSDFWHSVVTPAMILMSQLLTLCPIYSLEDVAAGLFVCCMFLEYVSLSKKFIPELINYLLGVLHLAVPRKESLDYVLVPPFKPHGKNSELLLVGNNEDIDTWVKKPLPITAINGLSESSELEISHFKLTCIATCLDLVRRCVDIYGPLPAFREILNPITTLLSKHLPTRDYSLQIQELQADILRTIEKNNKKPYQPLVFEKQMAVPMKMFTPKLMPVLEFGRKQGCNQQERERKKLIHKHKREFKGAVREIRRDNQFLARVKLSETMERDAERKRKVKELFNSLSTQEGEWKALKKKKLKGR